MRPTIIDEALAPIRQKSERSNSVRLHALDSLRGIAAFIVLLGHCALIWPEAARTQVPLWLSFTPLRIFVNGYACVILFFVLSGYVLAIPFLQAKKMPYISYLTKRVCRIYIPFVAGILLAALLYNFSVPAVAGEGSTWFRNEWGSKPLTMELVLRHLAMTGKSDEMWLDGVMWSLVDELRISIVFPFLMLLCRNLRTAIFLTVSIYVATVTATVISGNDWSMITSDSFAATFLLTLRFIPFFMIGIILVKYNEKIQMWMNRLPRAARWGFLVLALLIVCLPTEIHNRQILAMFKMEKNDTLIKYAIEALLGIASGFLIVFVRNIGESAAFFNLFAIKWLGKISYSLYLIHLPIALFMFRILLGRMPFLSICLLVIVTSLVAASVFYLVIERPSIWLGKNIAAKVTNLIAKTAQS